MIKNKTDMLDPVAENDLSEYEKQVVEDAKNAGNSPQSFGAAGNTTNTTGDGKGRGEDALSSTAARVGALNRTTVPGEIGAIETDEPGGDSDVSGGVANLAENTEAPVEQNEYNR
jgi:hypothetical protein